MPRRNVPPTLVPSNDASGYSIDTDKDPLELIGENPILSGLIAVPQEIDNEYTYPEKLNHSGNKPNLEELQQQSPTKDSNSLSRSTSLIFGDRESTYGDPYDLDKKIAALWLPILGIEVSVEKVALCLLAIKIAREIHCLNTDTFHGDNIDDMAGYVGLYERVRHRARQRRSGHG